MTERLLEITLPDGETWREGQGYFAARGVLVVNSSAEVKGPVLTVGDPFLLAVFGTRGAHYDSLANRVTLFTGGPPAGSGAVILGPDLSDKWWRFDPGSRSNDYGGDY